VLGFYPLSGVALASAGTENINVTNVIGTTSVGITQIALDVTITGVGATSAVGAVTLKIGVTQPVTGVFATGAVDQVNVWSSIVPNPAANNWPSITPNNNPNWRLVA